jgi:hypothetical protein
LNRREREAHRAAWRQRREYQLATQLHLARGLVYELGEDGRWSAEQTAAIQAAIENVVRIAGIEVTYRQVGQS